MLVEFLRSWKMSKLSFRWCIEKAHEFMTRDGNGALFTISPQWIPLIPSLYSIDAYLISSPSRYSSSIDMMYIYCCVLIYDPCLTVCWVDYFGKILIWYTVEVHRGRGNHEDKFTAWWSWRKYSPVVVDGGQWRWNFITVGTVTRMRPRWWGLMLYLFKNFS